MTDTPRLDAVLARYTADGWDYPDSEAMAHRIIALEDKVVTLEAALNSAGRFAVGNLAPRMVKLDQLLSTLENPDHGTVMAAVDAEWRHGQTDPDATRQTGARAALVGVATYLRRQLGL